MSKGVMAPLALTGIAVAVGNGWVESMWKYMYTATHTGAASNPFTTTSGTGSPVPGTTNPFNPVNVGKGGDAVTSGLPGLPQVTITGTMSGGNGLGGAGSHFVPNDPAIPAFNLGPAPNYIPSGILSAIYRMFGTKPSTGGSAGVTIA